MAENSGGASCRGDRRMYYQFGSSATVLSTSSAAAMAEGTIFLKET
jgi:hypothetical protein